MTNTPEGEETEELTPIEAAKMAGCWFNGFAVVTAIWATGLLISGNPFGAMTTGAMGLMSEIMATTYNRESKKLSSTEH